MDKQVNLDVLFQLNTEEEREIISQLMELPGQRYSSKSVLFAWATPRDLRRLIEHLRQDHHVPICGTPSEGYWWPASLEDASHCRNYFRSMITNFWKSAKGIEQGLQILYGQERLFEEEK